MSEIIGLILIYFDGSVIFAKKLTDNLKFCEKNLTDENIEKN